MPFAKQPAALVLFLGYCTVHSLARAETENVMNPAADRSTMPVVQELVAGSHLNLLWRHYAERFNIEEVGRRDAWVQSLQADFTSGFTSGPIGFGFEVAPFLAVKFNGGQGARNLVHFKADGSGQDQNAWGYFGKYALIAKLGGVTAKYGLQALANPMLSPYDIRSLPPTFRGLSLVSDRIHGVSLQAGSFDAVNARGDTSLRPLTTTEGGTRIRRFDYVGGDWNYAPTGRLVAYANQADQIWHQYYLSGAHGIGDPASFKLTAGADGYLTRSYGRRLQGDIDNRAYSLSLTGQRGASALMVGYQRNLGENFFDYVQESNGIYLSNSVGVDYNAPNERSVHYQYKLNGDQIGLPGAGLLAWTVRGWGTDASAGAARYAAPGSLLHHMYWKGNNPIHGSHQEYGLKLTQTVQDGYFKGAKVALVFIKHDIDPSYPGRGFLDYRVMIDFPVKVF